MVNFPKLKFSNNTLLILLVLTLLVAALNILLNAHLINSIVISSLIILLGIVIKGVYRRVQYNKFLLNIGIPINRATFYEGEYVMSVVPFKDKASACSVRIQDKSLIFGRSPVYRAVKLDTIENIELQDYFGHEVARVTLLPNQSEVNNVFYVPWSELLENEIEWCDGT